MHYHIWSGTLVSGVSGIAFFCDWAPYHCVCGGGYLMVGLHPPPPHPLSGILVTIRLRFPIGLSNNEHSYNGVGYDIIHAYVRLLSDMTSASNDNSYKKKTKGRHYPGNQFPRRYYVVLFAT